MAVVGPYSGMPEDHEVWERLAKAAHVRLPRADAALTTAGMGRFIKRLGYSVAAFQKETGWSIRDFVRDNEHFTLKAAAGCILETLDYLER